jgi:hypothetical protein
MQERRWGSISWVIKMFPWYVFVLFRLSAAQDSEESSIWPGPWRDEVNMVRFRPWGAAAITALSISQHAAAFNNPQNMPVWCGKIYTKE